MLLCNKIGIQTDDLYSKNMYDFDNDLSPEHKKNLSI